MNKVRTLPEIGARIIDVLTKEPLMTTRKIAITINLLMLSAMCLPGLSDSSVPAAEHQTAADVDRFVDQSRDLIKRAAKFYDEVDLAKARPLLEQAAQNLQQDKARKAGHLDNVLIELGQCYYAEKKYDLALDCFDRALRIRAAEHMSNSADRAALAELYAAHGQAAKGENLFESSADWLGLTDYSRKHSNLNKAILALNKYFGSLSGKPSSLLSPENLSLRRDLENFYKQTNRMKDAEALYTELVSAFQDSHKINVDELQISMGYLADFYYRNNVLEKAEPTLIKELKITKASREKLVCLFNLASLEEIRHSKSKAEKYYKQALDLSEDLRELSAEEKVNVIAQRSDFLWRQRKFPEAEKSIRSELSQLDNSSKSAWYRAFADSRLGLLLLSSGKLAEGESHLQHMLDKAIQQYKLSEDKERADYLLVIEQKAYYSLRMFYLQNRSYSKLQELALKQLDFVAANDALLYQKYDFLNLLFWAYCQDGKLAEAKELMQKNAELFEGQEPDIHIDRAVLASKNGDGKSAEQELFQAKKHLDEQEKPEPEQQKWPPAKGMYEINYSKNLGGSSPIGVPGISNGTISSFPIRLLNTADFKLYLPEPNVFGRTIKRSDGTERQSALFSIKEVDPPPKQRQRIYSLPLDENIGDISNELLPAYMDRLFANVYVLEGRNNEALKAYEKSSELEKRVVASHKNYLDARRLLNSTLNDYADFLIKQGKTQAAEIVRHQAAKVAQEISILSLSQ